MNLGVVVFPNASDSGASSHVKKLELAVGKSCGGIGEPDGRQNALRVLWKYNVVHTVHTYDDDMSTSKGVA